MEKEDELKWSDQENYCCQRKVMNSVNPAFLLSSKAPSIELIIRVNYQKSKANPFHGPLFIS